MVQSQSRPAEVAPAAEAAANGAVAAPVAVPDPPRLAPAVQLRGQMRDSGFTNQPWLIQAGDRFLQVPELLYRILEQIDGQQTLAEIVAGVSKSAGRGVSAENIRKLIATKLLPGGLVAAADSGEAVPLRGGALASPLGINLRLKVISPRVIDALTAFFQHLYAPPVVAIVLFGALLGHGWLYFAQGLAGSVANVLYAPWLLLALTGITVVAGAFHELGHAAALCYGGGRVRGMGVGIYLVYPVFYTDVTDSYRLGRWARVRTDLGGFYFNLIFQLGLIALYFLTGQPWLLVAVLLLDLEIIEQALPFVRFDGYWALADLTGIPDFFTLMGRYVRSVLPWTRGHGRPLPPLKPWVKLAFGLYILVTVPLLAFLLLVMVTTTPRILATTWDSAGRLAATFVGAQGRGDVPEMLAAGVQILVLGLPTVGLIYTLYSLGRLAVTTVWRWSSPTPTRRVAGALGTLAACGLLAYLWAPQLPWADRPGPLLAYVQEQFVPIRPGERGTVLDTLGVILKPSGPASAGGAPRVAPPTGPAGATAIAPATGVPQTPAGSPAGGQSAAPVGVGNESPAPAPTGTPTAGSGNPDSGSPPPPTGTPGPGPGGSPPPAPPPNTGGVLPPPVDGAVPTVVDVVPTVANAVPTVANVAPTVVNAVPSVVNSLPVVPTVVNAVPIVPTAVQAVPTVAAPVVNTAPTVAQAVPTVAQVVPTVAQKVPTVVQVVPTAVNKVPVVGTVTSALPPQLGDRRSPTPSPRR